jgi:small subunit ribosomal protein S16
MQKIRLSRWWKHKDPFFRVVVTEHTKPVKSGYKDVLWWFDPISHKSEINVEKVKDFISKWVKPTDRVAKILYQSTKDNFFKKYFTEGTRIRKPKKEEESK